VKFFRRDDGTCLEDLKLPTKRDDGKFERLRSIHVQDGVLLVVLYTRVEAFGHAAPPAAPPTAKKQADAP